MHITKIFIAFPFGGLVSAILVEADAGTPPGYHWGQIQGKWVGKIFGDQGSGGLSSGSYGQKQA
jgi:hypothetical protein